MEWSRWVGTPGEGRGNCPAVKSQRGGPGAESLEGSPGKSNPHWASEDDLGREHGLWQRRECLVRLGSFLNVE